MKMYFGCTDQDYNFCDHRYALATYTLQVSKKQIMDKPHVPYNHTHHEFHETEMQLLWLL